MPKWEVSSPFSICEVRVWVKVKAGLQLTLWLGKGQSKGWVRVKLKPGFGLKLGHRLGSELGLG